jgi:hypothetical protein
MKALNGAYLASHPGETSLCLFLIENVTGAEGIAGDMPRGKQFGYLFGGSTARTVAHEIGHGLFHLDHPFDRANAAKSFERGDLADNLMEYQDGTNLVKLQWDAIHAPGLVIGLFERDESGMAVDDEKRLYQILYSIGTDAFVFCKKCESEAVVSQGEFKFTIKGQTYKCSYGKILSDGNIEARYVTEPVSVDGTIRMATITTDKEQFIITQRKDHTVHLCEANEDYTDYCSLKQPFTNASFNRSVLRDISRCVELPDVSRYRVNREFNSPSSSTFVEIKEAVAAKLANSFFDNVRLCIDLTSSTGDYERLLTPGLADCSSAEIKLGIHVDYTGNKVWLDLDARDNYLQEYAGKWQSKAQEYESYWDVAVNMDDLRRQVISDLEDVRTAESFFDNLAHSLEALISDKIAGFVEGVQASQKIAKNVWDEGSINRSTWHSSDSEHGQWPGYAQFHPLTGGVADGIIGELAGIPVAIKGLYSIMTDREQQQALLAMFSKEGMSQLLGTLQSEARETLNDEERLLHFSSQTVIEISTILVPGMSVVKVGKMGELTETATKGLNTFDEISELKKKIDNLINGSKYLGSIKKTMKEFFDKMDPSFVVKLLKIDNFDEALSGMAQVRWRAVCL